MITPENRRAFLKLAVLAGGALLVGGEPPMKRNTHLNIITGEANFCGNFAKNLTGPVDARENKTDWLMDYEEIFKWCLQRMRHD